MFCLMEGATASLDFISGRRRDSSVDPALHGLSDPAHEICRFHEEGRPLHDDLFDFFYEALPGYEEVGRRRVLLGCWGSFQNPYVCDYDYRTMNEWGKAMYVTQASSSMGTLSRLTSSISTLASASFWDLRIMKIGKTRNICHARSPGIRSSASSLDERLFLSHRSATSTISIPGHVAALARQANRRSSRAGHRWRSDRQVVGHRFAGLVDIGYLKATGNSVKMILRKTGLKPEVEFEWKIPKWSNAIERNRARTYFQVYGACCALFFVEEAMKELHAGRTKTFTPFKVPSEAIGCGFHEAVRGVLSHHMVIRNGKVPLSYPRLRGMQSARIYGTPGPYEDAVQKSRSSENGPENFKESTSCRRLRN